MEKKVYYLMLLLCLSLFPFRVYALEDIIQNEDNDSITVIDTENQNQQDSLVIDSLDNQEKNSLEDSINTNNVENNEEIQSVMNLSDELLESNQNEESNVVTAIDEIDLGNVSLELWTDSLPSFAATIPENAPYDLIREGWEYYKGVYTSDEEYNNSLVDNNFEIYEGANYYYFFVLRLHDGYSFQSDNEYYLSFSNVHINDTIYTATANQIEENVYVFYPSIHNYPKNPNTIYLNELEIDNASTIAIDGKSPLYGAVSKTDHVMIGTEDWYTFVDDSSEFQVNYSNPEYLLDDENVFDTFSKDNSYYYEIRLKLDDGYGYDLNELYRNPNSFTIKVNGENVDPYYFAGYANDDGELVYSLMVKTGYTPIEEVYSVIEHADVSIDKSEHTDLAIRSDGDYKLFLDVYVDKKLVDSSNYSDSQGSTIIKFLDSYLQTLDVGTHEVAITYSDGKAAYTTLTITDDSVVEKVEEETIAPVVYQTTSNSSYQPVAARVTNVLEEAKEKEDIPQEEEDEEEEEFEPKKDTVGLWIGLVALIVIAVMIPVALYKKDE